MLHEEARVTAAVKLKALDKLVKLNKIKLKAKSGMQFTLIMIHNDYSAVSDRGT